MKNEIVMDGNRTPRYIFETTPKISAHMSKIRSKNTQPELILRKALWKSGVRYRINVKKLPGKPDIVIKNKLVVFVDGEFWHGFMWEHKKLKIKANKEYWIPKIERNIQRDIKNTQDLENMGYLVLRFWEKEIRKDLEGCLLRINQTLRETTK